MADSTVFQGFLVLVVGEVDISCLPAIYQNNFRTSVLSSKRKAHKSCPQQKAANQQQGDYFFIHRILLRFLLSK